MTEPSTTATTAGGPGVSAKLSQAAIDHAKSRGISERTLAVLGAGSGTAFFPGRLKNKSEAMFFPYHQDGELVNWKACAFPDKDFIGMKGGTQCFFGIDRVLAATPGDVFFAEGEWDVAALVEAGIPSDRVLSVPSGAKDKAPSEDDDDVPSGYPYVEDALRRGLGKHKRFIWCGDMDGPGLALRKDMAAILGAARFCFVDWPEGCKDANDMLRADGPEAVADLVINGALPWPVSGLYSLYDLPEEPPVNPWRIPGFPSWEGKIRLAPGTLSVVTGHGGHGKTHVFAQVWQGIAEREGLVIATATFETRAKPYYRRILRTLHSGMLAKDMDARSTQEADDWINAHYRWMVHPDHKATLQWLMDTAEVAVVRHGAKVVQIDPWNRVEHDRGRNERETDYIGRCIKELYSFAKDMNCHVQIIAHPSKRDSKNRSHPPTLEDIADSKHWDSMPDQGFAVHRPKMFDGQERCTEAHVYHLKSRFEELGYPCRPTVKLNVDAGRFEEAEG